MRSTAQLSNTRRGGFSLLEMLVVISILVALVAIATAVYGTILETGREAATRATIAKAETLLQDQITAWRREFEGSNLVDAEAVSRDLDIDYDAICEPDDNPQQSRLVAFKGLFRLHFPQSLDDVNLHLSSPPPSAYAAWSTGGGPSGEEDSSELLYLTLTNGKVRGSTPVDTDSFSGNELADTDGDGFQEIVDGWGKPLRFYRWPTRLLILGSLSTAATLRDPDDPRGIALNCDPAAFEHDLHTVDSYHTPLIVSAGGDNDFGLLAPDDIDNFGHLAEPAAGATGGGPLSDNITNLSGGN